jgi:hypothetical protein
MKIPYYENDRGDLITYCQFREQANSQSYSMATPMVGSAFCTADYVHKCPHGGGKVEDENAVYCNATKQEGETCHQKQV